MKKRNKGQLSKKAELIKILLMLFIAVTVANAQMKVEVQTLPNPSYKDSFELQGTLTDLAKISSKEKVGLHTVKFSWADPDFTPKKEECECKTKGEKEKTYTAKIKASDLTAKLNFTVTIDLPFWTNRGKSTCQSATNEWNNFYAKVKAHEEGHHAVAKGFLTQENIQAYFTGIKDKESKQCVLESKYESESADVEGKLEEEYEKITKKIKMKYDQEQERYHNEGDHILIDVSKECS